MTLTQTEGNQTKEMRRKTMKNARQLWWCCCCRSPINVGTNPFADKTKSIMSIQLLAMSAAHNRPASSTLCLDSLPITIYRLRLLLLQLFAHCCQSSHSHSISFFLKQKKCFFLFFYSVCASRMEIVSTTADAVAVWFVCTMQHYVYINISSFLYWFIVRN